MTSLQLHRWGVSTDSLRFAVVDLRDFLHVHRGPRWHEALSDKADEEARYELAHEAFSRYVQADADLASGLLGMHATIASRALVDHAGRWEQVDAEDAEDLYDIRHVAAHLQAMGREAGEIGQDLGPDYIAACIALSTLAYGRSRYRAVLDLMENVIGILRPLVEAGRTELANDLAAALMNKGNAQQGLGELRAAIQSYDEAIGILRPLVEAGRTELANDLAAALMNKGNVLAQEDRWQEAIDCYDKGIALWQAQIEAGRTHFLPMLLKARGIRIDLFRRLSYWDAAAEEVMEAIAGIVPHLESDTLSEGLAREFGAFLYRLQALAPAERAGLSAALGPELTQWLRARFGLWSDENVTEAEAADGSEQDD